MAGDTYAAWQEREHGYRENPAAFKALLAKRPLIDLALIEPELKIASYRLAWARTKSGKRVPALAGGPRIVYRRPNGQRATGSFFTQTSKMSCFSWSIPAGPTEQRGTCPAATRRDIPAHDAEPTVDRALAQPRASGSGFICGECLSGDQLVLVRRRGFMRLDDAVSRVEDGESLEVLHDAGWSRITQAWRKGIQPLVRVRTSSGFDVRCTADHKILADGEWVEAGDLEPGMRLAVAPRLGVGDGQRWPTSVTIPVIEETEPELARASSYTRARFPVKWSFEVGLVLGYLQGDGSVSYVKPLKPGAHSYPVVSLTGSEEDVVSIREIVDIVNGWAASETTLRTVTPGESTLKTGQRVAVNHRICTATWRRLGLVRFLETLGLDKRSAPELRRVPSTLWSATEDGVRGYLSGLFSTDGSIVENGDGKIALILAQVSRPLLRDVQLLLSAFGIHATVCAYRTSNRARVRAGYRRLYKLEIGAKESVAAFRECIGFHNVRKAARLSTAELAYGKMGRPLPPGAPSKTSPPPARYATVESIEEDEFGEVYDIEVDHPSHRFLANGLIVSNCYAGKNRYLYGSIQKAQSLRYAWIARAMAAGTFVEEMFRALMATFDAPSAAFAAVEIDPRYFRIHDSGDFFDPTYYAAWAEICAMASAIRFWAPTRMWVFPEWRTHMTETIGVPANLALRPSALWFNAPTPRIRGFAAGSGAGVDPKAWDCPAWGTGSCGTAEGPTGTTPCRTCWIGKTPVVYHKH